MNNTDLEKAVLGCLVLDKQDYILKLTENDFTQEANKLICNAIRYLYDKKRKIDIITVSDLIKKRLPNSIVYITDLTTYITTTESIDSYLTQLKHYTFIRDSKTAISRATELIDNSNGDLTIDLKNNLQQLFDIPILEDKKNEYSRGELLDRIETRRNMKHEELYYTGFADLDNLTAGLHKQEMTVIAARPGVGKTAFLVQLMINLSKKKLNGLFVSREMSEEQLDYRFLSNLSGVDGQRIRFAKTLTVEDWKKLAEANGIYYEMPVIIDDSTKHVEEIRNVCRELKNKGKLDVLGIDYLQICGTLKKTQTREREVAEMSSAIKQMSKEFDIPVICLSQLNRNIEQRANDEPVLSDLRESGSIEQDSDNIIFLHVPKDTDITEDIFSIKAIIAKQRNGPTGAIWLKYCRKNFKFWGCR